MRDEKFWRKQLLTMEEKEREGGVGGEGEGGRKSEVLHGNQSCLWTGAILCFLQTILISEPLPKE